MLIELIWVIVGFVLLMGGADYVVKGSCELANRLGVPPLVIGLTIVAAGTSAPELFVSANAALKGSADVAIGNVVGSNTFNILVIIGLATLFKTLSVSVAIIRREMPLMLIISAVFIAFCMNGYISRWEGLLLTGGMFSYLLMNYILVMSAPVRSKLDNENSDVVEIANLPIWLSLFFIVGGIVAMIFGSDFVVDSATVIAKSIGISDLIIGITLVAIGTSLPEVAATVASARRNQADIALGNAVGSNIFNVLCVIGISALITPINVSEQVIFFDNWLMLASCLLVYILMRINGKIGKISGIVFLICYLSYISYSVVS